MRQDAASHKAAGIRPGDHRTDRQDSAWHSLPPPSPARNAVINPSRPCPPMPASSSTTARVAGSG